MEVIIPLFFVFFTGVIIVGIVAAVRSARKADEAWMRAAAGLGLDLRDRGMFKAREMKGRVDDCHVLVDTYTQGSGKNSTTYSRFRVGYPRPLDVDLKLTKQGFFSGVARAFGAQDIEVGDQVFDDQVVVKGENERAVRAFLTPERRRTIRQLFLAYPGIEIEDDEVRWSKRGVIRDEAVLKAVTHELVAGAVALASDGEPKLAPPPPAPVAPPAPPPPLPDDEIGREVEADGAVRLPVPLGRAPEPAQASVEAREEAPTPERPEPVPAAPPGPMPPADDRPLAREAVATREPAEPASDSPAAPGPVGEPDPDEAAPGPEGEAPLDAEAVCRRLFAEGASTFDAGRSFDAEFKGRAVEGTGTLTRAERFSFDFVLGREGGTKAQVEIYRVKGDWKDEVVVTAVLGLPPEALDALSALEGRPIRFRGRLAKVDALMKNLFVLEAEVMAA